MTRPVIDVLPGPLSRDDVAATFRRAAECMRAAQASAEASDHIGAVAALRRAVGLMRTAEAGLRTVAYRRAAVTALRASARPRSRGPVPRLDRVAAVADELAALVADLRLRAGLETEPQPFFRPGGSIEWREPPRLGPLTKRDRLRLRNLAIARLAACYARIAARRASFGGCITTPAARFVEAGLREVARLSGGVIVACEMRAVGIRLQRGRALLDRLRDGATSWDALPDTLGGRRPKQST